MTRTPSEPSHSRTRRTIITGVVIGLLILGLIAGGFFAVRWVSGKLGTPTPPPKSRCVSSIDGSTAELSLEQSRNASIIAGIAALRGLEPRAVSIALATAFQESGIRNLDYGDRDSLGIFQQRPSQGWGTEEEIMDPYYSTGKFFDVMVTVKDWQNADIGDVAQKVQRSAYPDAYDKHVDRARTLASALSGQTQAAWSCVSTELADPDPTSLLSSLTRAYGPTISATVREATPEAPAVISVTALSEAVAWSAAAFAQSWSSETGVSEVRVGNNQWTASTKVLPGWVRVTDDSVSTATVVVTF